MITPTISVLIPVHNAEPTVRQAVDSILRQTLVHFEIVAVDDGSTDSTPEYLDSAARQDPRVRVIHTGHGGIISALNTGISECRAPYIARMDADDVSHPSRLQCQLDYLTAHPDISVCAPLVRMFPRSAVRGGLERYQEWMNSLVTPDQIARDMFVESPLPHPGVMMRTDELRDIGGYQEHGWAEDYDLWLRYHQAGRRFGKVRKTLIFWRQTEGRLTFSDSRYSVENFLRAKAHYLARRLLPLGRPVVLWGSGQTGRRLLKHLVRERVDVEAVVDIDPHRVGRKLRGRPVVSPDYLVGRGSAFVVAAVNSHSARELIRDALRKMGFTETRDFVCAA